MRTILLSLCCLFMAGKTAMAEGSLYDAASIPPALLVNANAVIRSCEEAFIIKSPTRAVYRVHKIITVLSGKGSDFADVMIFYDPSIKVNSFRAEIYDQHGVMVTEADKSDLRDYSAVDGGSLFTDDMCKVYNPVMNTYPFTFEFEYEKEFTELMNYVTWAPQGRFNLSVESSVFYLSIAEGITPRIRQENFPDPPATFKDKGATVMQWTARMLPARDAEPYSPDLRDIVPVIRVAPSAFTIAGYTGTMTTWKEYGDFMYMLNKDRADLSPETIEKVKQMVDTIPDRTGRIRALYRYMQSKTRYISVQVGIGGQRCEAASAVDRKGYGDCKALVNYMESLLAAAGITSFPALVYAGEDNPSVLIDFPSDQFNHVILCVPAEKDTIWLECTDQQLPFGFLGNFTDDRPVLLVTPGGGVLARTPRYGNKENAFKGSAEITLDSAGNANVIYTNVYQGIEYILVKAIAEKPFTEQKKTLENRLGISACKVLGVSYTLNKTMVPVAVEQIKVYIPAFATITGNRYFLPLAIQTFTGQHPKKAEKRTADLVLQREVFYSDSLTIKYPSSFKIESLPAGQDLSSPYGSYHFSVRPADSGITVIRTAATNEGVFPPDQYNAFVDFYKQVARSSKEKAIILKE